MKQALILFSFLLLCSALSAQQEEVHESDLIGDWQQVAIELLGKYSSETDSLVLSIFPNHLFHSMRQPENSPAPDPLVSGSWSLDSDTREITFSRPALWFNSSSISDGESVVEVELVNDSVLILQSRLGTHPVFCSFRRVSAFANADSLLAPATPLYSFTQDIWLRNSANPLKRKRIRPNSTLTLYPAVQGDTTSYDASGSLRMASSGQMVMCIEEENMEIVRNESNVETINRFWCIDDAPCRTFSTTELELHVTTPASNTLRIVGANLISFGALTALLVAPLASINYGNGSFNKDRYFSIAGAGLASVAVGIPLVSFTGGKFYLLQPPDAVPDRDHWIVDTNP
jgi:hypothetical protein